MPFFRTPNRKAATEKRKSTSNTPAGAAARVNKRRKRANKPSAQQRSSSVVRAPKSKHSSTANGDDDGYDTDGGGAATDDGGDESDHDGDNTSMKGGASAAAAESASAAAADDEDEFADADKKLAELEASRAREEQAIRDGGKSAAADSASADAPRRHSSLYQKAKELPRAALGGVFGVLKAVTSTVLYPFMPSSAPAPAAAVATSTVEGGAAATAAVAEKEEKIKHLESKLKSFEDEMLAIRKELHWSAAEREAAGEAAGTGTGASARKRRRRKERAAAEKAAGLTAGGGGGVPTAPAAPAAPDAPMAPAAPEAPSAPSAPSAPTSFGERSVAFSFASSIANAKLKKAAAGDSGKSKTSESGGFSISASDIASVKLRPRAMSVDGGDHHPRPPASAGAGGALVTLDQLKAVQLRKRSGSVTANGGANGSQSAHTHTQIGPIDFREMAALQLKKTTRTRSPGGTPSKQPPARSSTTSTTAAAAGGADSENRLPSDGSVPTHMDMSRHPALIKLAKRNLNQPPEPASPFVSSTPAPSPFAVSLRPVAASASPVVPTAPAAPSTPASIFGAVLRSNSSVSNQANVMKPSPAAAASPVPTTSFKKPPLRHTAPPAAATTTLPPQTPLPVSGKAVSAFASVFDRVGSRFAADPHAAEFMGLVSDQNRARLDSNLCSPFPMDRATPTPLRS